SQVSYSVLKEENNHLQAKNKKLIQKIQILIKKTKLLEFQNHHFQQKTYRQISEICFLVHRSKNVSLKEFKKQVKTLFKSNDQHYSSNMIWFTTKLAQVKQVSFSTEHVLTWHKQILELSISNLAKHAQQSSAF
ncbi:8053_t:CDS:2, partial [Cetraspora pellucida]